MPQDSAPRLFLIGDSILDNQPYTSPAPDTTTLLQSLLPQWQVVRLAVDGSMVKDLPVQLGRSDEHADVGVLSIGGNDALTVIDLLDRPASGSGEILDEMHGIMRDFDRRYERAVTLVRPRCTRLIVCTIYNVPFDQPRYAERALVLLAVLNGVIIEVAARHRLEVLELRSICTDADDFVFQIEPSAKGAAKIADAIADVVTAAAALGPVRLFSR